MEKGNEKGKIVDLDGKRFQDGNGDSKQKQNVGIDLETCVIVMRDKDGGYGIATKTNIETKRELEAREVPGFLVEASFALQTTLIMDGVNETLNRALSGAGPAKEDVVEDEKNIPVDESCQKDDSPVGEPNTDNSPSNDK